MGKFDKEGSVQRLAAMYTSGDVVRQRERVLELLGPRPGERVVDIGCGTGLLATQLAELVAPAGEVLAVDASERMVAATQQAAASKELAVRVVRADATDLPAENGWADLAVATQVLEYVPDVERALAEAHRCLRPGGRLLILDTEWRSCVWETDDRDLTDRLLRSWRDHFVHPDLPRRLPQLLRDAGFDDIEADAIPIVNLTMGEHDYSRGMLDTILAFLRRHPDVDAADLERFETDLRDRAVNGRYYFALIRSVFLTRKPVGSRSAS